MILVHVKYYYERGKSSCKRRSEEGGQDVETELGLNVNSREAGVFFACLVQHQIPSAQSGDWHTVDAQ